MAYDACVLQHNQADMDMDMPVVSTQLTADEMGKYAKLITRPILSQKHVVLFLSDKIGSGTYSDVYRGISKAGKLVAVKRYKNEYGDSLCCNSTIIRELDTLKLFKGNPRIVQVVDVVFGGGGYNVDMVMEYMPINLMDYVKQCREMKGYGLPRCMLRKAAFQFLQGVAFCHEQKILHRDIKTANLLMDEYGNVKLADFGLAKTLLSGVFMEYCSQNIITLNYRPLELMVLSHPQYGFEVDLCSCGIVLAEMAMGGHLFNVADIPEMIVKTICVFGKNNSISEEDMPEQTSLEYSLSMPLNADKLKEYYKRKGMGIKSSEMREAVPLASRIAYLVQQFADEAEYAQFLQIILSLACVNRCKRVSAHKVLIENESWFVPE